MSPSTASLDAAGTQQFAATVLDQFGDEVAAPVLTWSATAGSIDSDGLYTAPAASSEVTVTATCGSLTSTSAVTVTNHAPTVSTAAAAEQVAATATISLTALGADDAGETSLTYTWQTLSLPSGATVSFDEVNGTNDGQATIATVDQLGDYQFQVAMADGGGLSVTSQVTITVVQTLTGISLFASSPDVSVGGPEQFGAMGYDQFGEPMATQPTFSWSVTAGSVDDSGMYTAPGACLPVTISVQADGVTGSNSVTLVNPSPTMSCRLGDSWLEAYWEESLGSPDTRQQRIAQAAGTATLALSTAGPGNGFLIDPTGTFSLSTPANYDNTIETDPAAASYEWETEGIAFDSLEDTESTLVIHETVDEYGAWTYSETYTLAYDITTTADEEAFSSATGSYSYTFTASGDADGSAWQYVVTVNAPVTSPTGDSEWSQTTATTDTITNTTDNAANTRAGSCSGSGSASWSYPSDISGGEGSLEFTYSVDYFWSPTTGWTTGCTASNTKSDSSEPSEPFSYSDDYSDSGVGWSCEGTMSGECNDTWSYSYTTNYELQPDGTWQPVSGSGGSSGNGFWRDSYDEEGNYWPASTDEQTSGTFEDGALDESTYWYVTYATYDDGSWDESGTGTVLSDGNDYFSYNGSGSYSNDAGSGTQFERGSEQNTYTERRDYRICLRGRHITVHGTGNCSARPLFESTGPTRVEEHQFVWRGDIL